MDKKSPPANGIPDHFQASQPCPQRRNRGAFEPGMPYGEKISTKKTSLSSAKYNHDFKYDPI
jgi:hypothetical protein